MTLFQTEEPVLIFRRCLESRFGTSGPLLISLGEGKSLNTESLSSKTGPSLKLVDITPMPSAIVACCRTIFGLATMVVRNDISNEWSSNHSHLKTCAWAYMPIVQRMEIWFDRRRIWFVRRCRCKFHRQIQNECCTDRHARDEDLVVFYIIEILVVHLVNNCATVERVTGS